MESGLEKLKEEFFEKLFSIIELQDEIQFMVESSMPIKLEVGNPEHIQLVKKIRELSVITEKLKECKELAKSSILFNGIWI